MNLLLPELLFRVKPPRSDLLLRSNLPLLTMIPPLPVAGPDPSLSILLPAGLWGGLQMQGRGAEDRPVKSTGLRCRTCIWTGIPVKPVFILRKPIPIPCKPVFILASPIPIPQGQGKRRRQAGRFNVRSPERSGPLAFRWEQ